QHRMVFVSGNAGHCAADEYWRMVPQKSSPSPEAGSCRSGTPSLAWFRPSSCGSIQPANRLEPRDSRGADVFQVLLSRKLDELLHVLPDEQIPPHGSECYLLRMDDGVRVVRRAPELWVTVVDCRPGLHGALDEADSFYTVRAVTADLAQPARLAAVPPAPLHGWTGPVHGLRAEILE